MRGSSSWARSHQTVAFCFRIRETYDEGELLDRDEVDRRIDEAYDEGAAGTRPCTLLLCVLAVDVVALDKVRRDWFDGGG